MTPLTVARLGITGIGFVYAGALYLNEVPLNAGVKSILSYLPTLGVFAVLVFDAWVWKLKACYLVFRRPRLDGTWSVTIQPHPDSHIPDGGNKGPIPGAVVIEQSFFSLHVRQYTAESTSRSTTAKIRPRGESRQHVTLAYAYTNEPKQKHRARSPIHLGASELHAVGHAPEAIEGTYWTDRFTAGDMKLTLVNREVGYGSFEAVRKATGKKARKKKR